MSSKNIKKRANILMCATLLSTSALPVTPVFADDGSSVIEKTTSDKPANGVSDQAQPTNIITDMWGTAPVSYNKVNGELTVSSGTIDNIGGDIGNSSIKKQDITKIIISGDVKLPSRSDNLFSGSYFPNLVVIEGSFDTSNVTDMSYMFFNSKLTSLDVSQWNTSNVTDMSNMFLVSKLTSLDVSQWNTSNVTDMSYMFEDSELTSLDVSQWNTSNVTDMSHMFHNSKLTSLDVSQWNTSNVTDMNYMFVNSELTSLDVSQWNTSNVTDMSDMFAVSRKLTSLDVSQWNTSNVTDMSHMFSGTNLTELDLTNWDTSKVKSFTGMLNGVEIKKLTLGSKTKLHRYAFLSNISRSSGVYTGRWERIDPVSPQSFYNDSDAFMSNYDGSFPGTYVWEKTKVKAADVTAKYLDENGKTISDDVVKNGNVGDSYTTEQKAIPGYTFKAVQGNPTGQFTSDAQTVTYIYTKDPVAGGNVTVKYVDGAGNTISDNVVKSGNIGDDYSTDQKAIPGYTFKEIQGSASGQFTDQEQTVTYVYTKDNDKPVITAPNQDYKVGDSIDPLKNVTASDKEDGTTKVTVAKIVDQDGKVIDSIPNDKAGKYTVTYTTTDADGNTVTKDATISVRSNDKPVITAPNQDYKVGDSIDPLKNVTASDKEDGTTKVTVAKIVDQDGKVIDSIPNDKAGKYTVTYTTTDADGNTVTKDATISVRSNDKPVITAPNQDYKVGDSIDPLKNVTASDKEDGTTKVTVAKIVDQDGKVIDSIPNDKAGKYTVTYTTTDADGNTVTKDATISVRSNDKPVITAPNQDYKVGDSIDPLKNVTASDKEDGTTKVTVAKIVDQDGKVIDSIPNDKAGKYTVTYTTTDADGNTVTKDATISVRSNDKTVITAPNQDYKVGDSIDPLKNVTASDKEDGTTKVTVAKIVDQDGKVIDSIPNDKAGKYTVTYTTTDADGNTVTKDATISVRSNDKPVITAPNQDYKVGDSIDPLKNVTASDKEDGTTKVTVAKIVDQDGKVIDSIPNDKAGKYTVTYTTTDADGNTVTKDATISVRSNEKPGNGTDNGNPSSNQPGNPSQPSNATNNGVINTSTNIGSKVNNGAVNSPELPQTGENNRQSQTMSFIGVLLAMFGSLLGFLGIKKRRND